jgi:hypothetical protein
VTRVRTVHPIHTMMPVAVVLDARSRVWHPPRCLRVDVHRLRLVRELNVLMRVVYRWVITSVRLMGLLVAEMLVVTMMAAHTHSA